MQTRRQIRSGGTEPRVWLACLLIIVGATGCRTVHHVGIKEKLQPPPGHSSAQVAQVRSAWDKAQKLYRKRRLELRQRLLVRGYQDRDSGLRETFIMQGVSTPVHWKELLEATGQADLAKQIHQKQVRTGKLVGTITLVLAIAGLGAGGAMAAVAIARPDPSNGGQLKPELGLLGGGAVVGGVGLVALLATVWAFSDTFGIEPTKDQLIDATTTYNKALKKNLGLDQKAPKRPPINVGP